MPRACVATKASNRIFEATAEPFRPRTEQSPRALGELLVASENGRVQDDVHAISSSASLHVDNGTVARNSYFGSGFGRASVPENLMVTLFNFSQPGGAFPSWERI